MLQKIFITRNDWVGFITRLSVGIIMFPHGAQKVLGWFRGPGFAEEMRYFTKTAHLPWLIAFLVIFIEFVGAISLILGFASRLWSMAMIILFIGMIFTAHIQNGFFMNWFGTQQGEGYEYHLLIIGLSLATLINGSGKYAIDNLITQKTNIKTSLVV